MRRLLTPGWLAVHALVLVSMVGMLGLAGWQWSRAAGGNALSWGYAFQWPVFAGFAGLIWWREVRRTLRDARAAASPPGPPAAVGAPAAGSGSTLVEAAATAAARRPVITRRPPPARAYDASDDPELAAYNRYLAWMRANPGARPVDYPG